MTIRTLRTPLSILLLVAISMASILLFAPNVSHAQLSDVERRAQLEAELRILEQQIAEQEVILNKQKSETGSITRDVSVLTAEINAKKLDIKKKNALIGELSHTINQKDVAISNLHSELNREKASLARLIRNVYEVQSFSLPEIALSAGSISDFFVDLDAFNQFHDDFEVSFITIQKNREKTESEKQELKQKAQEQADLKYKLEQEKKGVEVKESEKKSLLAVSKNKEKSYQDFINARKAQAARIRAALFELRGQQGIAFGDALTFARAAEKRTGVRAAFILAVLKQESNLGKNVGTCNRPGDTRTWKDIMPGPNDNSWRDDQTTYLSIMQELGLPPEGQPLSCPLTSGGWGGAMGPSQFIPTTWRSYQSKIASAMGVSVPNPWIPEHAITATAVYMRDLGAAAQSYSAEIDAACKYYSGRSCSDPKVQNLFYGNAVMQHAKNIQVDIDYLDSAV